MVISSHVPKIEGVTSVLRTRVCFQDAGIINADIQQ